MIVTYISDQEIRTSPFPQSTNPDVESPAQFFAPVWGLLGSNVWLAGGSIVRYLEGRGNVQDGDFDIFSSNPEGVVLPSQAYLIQETDKVKTYEVPQEEGYRARFSYDVWKVQVIQKPYASMLDVINGFDFTVRQCITDGKELVTGPTTLMDIAARKLVARIEEMESSNITSLHGLVRYANRGYTLDYNNARAFLKKWGANVPEGANY